MSFFEHISLAAGENDELIALSVASSVQCCMVMSGAGAPVRSIFISHRPALRKGSSAATASGTGTATSQQAPNANETSCRVMLRTPG
jgi:hypothetical protein